MRPPLLALILPTVLCFTTAPCSALAATWHVSTDGVGDALTIQAGIDSAAVRDTVLVAPGVYAERIDFLGKDIVLTSESGPEFTVIDGLNRLGSVVQIRSGESRNAVLEGFTIMRGKGNPVTGTHPGNEGGGIFVLHSEPTIRGNIIERNLVDSYGGGIVSGGESLQGPLIEDNIVRTNRAGTLGGGIYIESGIVRRNVIEDNEVGHGWGGGIAIWPRSPDVVVIEDNLILNNAAGNYGGGIASFPRTNNSLATVRITGNLVARCYAGGDATSSALAGGGIAISGMIQELRNNTIVFNQSRENPSALGGGIAIWSGSPILERNIITNSTGSGVHCEPGATPILRDNIAWSNSDGHGFGDCVGWELTNGNLEADPEFCDPSSNMFRVAAFSPALSHPAGYLGAYPDPGCDAVRVETLTWGRLKRMGR